MRRPIKKSLIYPAIISLLLLPPCQILIGAEITTLRPEGTSTGIFTPALIENAMEVSGAQQTIFALERYSFWIFGHLFYTNAGISHHCLSAVSLWFVLIFLAIVSLWRLILEVVHEHDGKKADMISFSHTIINIT